MSTLNGRHWIGGEWETQPAAAFESINPADGRVLGRVSDADLGRVTSAISAARQVFDASDWAHSPRVRARVLLDFAARVSARLQPLAHLLTLENGKPITAARMEIEACVSELEYYAGLARTISGRTFEVSPGAYSILQREPAGVAAIITPWNAPGILLVRSLAPALAAGCTAVIKCAGKTGLFQSALIECLSDVPELPRGAVNSFMESGNEGARELVRSDTVDVLAYTGSTRVGREIMADAAGTLKRLCLELGGKAPCIVLADADIDSTARSIARAGTILAGQQCTAASRVLVHESIATPFRTALVQALDSIVVGDGLSAGTEMGPLIDQPSRDRIERLAQIAAMHGEVLLAPKRPAGANENGAFLKPGLVAVQDLDAPGASEEVFGPLMNLETFSSDREAIDRANHHPYGLAASVWGRDIGRCMRIARRIRSGTVWLNAHNVLMPEVETGGLRDSGFGRQHGVEGLEFFLQTRHIYRADAA